MERKMIHISGKRQITIPQKYFDLLGFSKEAECILKDDMLLIKPVRDKGSGDFAEQILADLIAQGYSGQGLLDKFKEEQRKVRPAVEKMIEKAKGAANEKGQSYTYDDIFGEVE